MTTRLKAMVFDSGVGGVSILKEVLNRYPSLDTCYLMDSAAFPYGTKPDDFLVQRIVTVCQQAIAQYQPDILIVACNTASTLALEALRTELKIPVVGVVPAIKVAAEYALRGEDGEAEIGLLATEATVKRSYTDQLCQRFSATIPIHKFGSHQLVDIAECLALGDNINEILYQHLQHWLQSRPAMRYVVLGCTHFPLLRQQLEEIWPLIHWIDSGSAIARRVGDLLNLSPNTSAIGQSSEFRGEVSVLIMNTGPEQPSGVQNLLAAEGWGFQSTQLHFDPVNELV